MKNNDMKEDKIPIWKEFLIFASMIVPAMIFCFCCTPELNAQETKKSEWVETDVVEVPYDIDIEQGITRNGNPKFYIPIDGTNIAVSESNYYKFKNKEIVLVIVEWYNPTTGKYKYTTRQKKQSTVKKLNLDNL